MDAQKPSELVGRVDIGTPPQVEVKPSAIEAPKTGENVNVGTKEVVSTINLPTDSPIKTGPEKTGPTVPTEQLTSKAIIPGDLGSELAAIEENVSIGANEQK